MLTSTAFPASSDRLISVGGQASPGKVPCAYTLHPAAPRSPEVLSTTGGGINPGDARAFQSAYRPALRTRPVRGEIRGRGTVLRDEHGVHLHNATAIQGLLVLQAQDQRAVQLYPWHGFLGPGSVGTVRPRTVPGQFGKVVPLWEDQPMGQQQPKIDLLGVAESGLVEGSGENLVGSRPSGGHTFTRPPPSSVVKKLLDY